MRRAVPTFVVDAFTLKPYLGNPAAICYLCKHDILHDDTLQAIAAEMNLSETAFLFPLPPATTGAQTNTGSGAFTLGIRWFTPEREVGLCGHATLAAAHSMFTESAAKDVFGFSAHQYDSIIFVGTGTLAQGVRLTVSRRDTDKSPAAVGRDAAVCGRSNEFVPARKGSYDMEFPARPPAPVQLSREARAALAKGLGVDNLDDIVDVQLEKNSRKYLVVLRDAEKIAALKADPALLQKTFLPPVPPLSVTVTAAAEGNAETVHGPHDVVSRHFAPWVGIPEDPVTGAAHIVLVPYWFAARPTQFRRTLLCLQASKRGGYMRVATVPDRPNVLTLSGGASTMLAGTHYACVNFRYATLAAAKGTSKL